MGFCSQPEISYLLFQLLKNCLFTPFFEELIYSYILESICSICFPLDSQHRNDKKLAINNGWVRCKVKRFSKLYIFRDVWTIFFKELNKESERIIFFTRVAHRAVSAPCVGKTVPRVAEPYLLVGWFVSLLGRIVSHRVTLRQF